jgi:4-hydroxybenzoate polyprenyltransferase
MAKHRPPWRAMAWLALIGIALVVLGVIGDAPWLALIGAIPLGVAPVGLLLPAFKISSERAPQPGRAYRDQNFFGGAMTVLGFRPSEQDEAREERQAARDEP